jgi:hypothetical protein
MQNSTNMTVNQGLMGVQKVSAFHPFIFQKSGKSLLALKIRISVANMGKLRSIGQVPVTYA